ncbi:GatB/YqeY domain-containing protein [Campylobacter geochelonis]|uniref:GatB/YqeY domain-containing protein n=1 Tax=Campylobacter geochelonis TaxID=1780362 RepID=UPI000770A38D|nr:GatB/YqeY domain-containing protein [Campylobacter geochelonis]CZE51234.1 GatB/Yqey family protein [Campylobacter geochelonis]
MSIKTQLLEDVKSAMKEKANFKRDTLRVILATLKQVEVDERIELGDDRILSILQSEIKKRNDSVEQYTKGGRQDLADKEKEEILIIQNYLPKQLSEDELNEKISKIIKQTGATSIKDLGKVMKVAKDEIGAACDGKRISQSVKSLLEKLA